MDDEPRDSPREGLREATLAGVRWVTFSRVAAELGGVASLVTLSRLIPPAEFGRAALALALSALATIGMAQTFSAPLVQRKALERRHWETATAAALASGLLFTVLALAFAALSPPLFGHRTAHLVALAAPVFLIAAVGATPQARLQRRLDFRRLSVIEAASTLAGLSVAISFAAAGVDAPAIVAGVLVSASSSSVALVRSAGLPRPRWQRATARELSAFGLPAGLAAVLYTLYRNIDYAILAARLSAAQLGFYWRAFQLGVEYPGKVSAIMFRVVFPVYSRTTGPDQMLAVRRRVVRIHTAVLVPPLGAFIGLAPVLVPWLLGARWEPAVGPAQILAGAGILATVMTDVGPLVLAAGRPRALVAFDATTLVVYGVAVYVAAPHGLTTVCFTVLGVQLAIFLAAHRLLLERLLGVSMHGVVVQTLPGLVTGAVALGVAASLVAALRAAGAPNALLLALATAASLGASALVVRRLFGEVWRDGALLARTLRRSEGPSSAEPPGEIPVGDPAPAPRA